MALIGGQMYRFLWWQFHNYCLSWHERIIQTFHDSSMSLPQELQVFMKWRIQKSHAFFTHHNHNTTVLKSVKHISFWIKAVLCACWPLCIASAWQITLFHSTDIERIYGCEMPRRFEVLWLCWPCCVTWLKYFYCLQRLKSFRRGRGFKSYVCMCRRLWLQSQTLDFH